MPRNWLSVRVELLSGAPAAPAVAERSDAAYARISTPRPRVRSTADLRKLAWTVLSMPVDAGRVPRRARARRAGRRSGPRAPWTAKSLPGRPARTGDDCSRSRLPRRRRSDEAPARTLSARCARGPSASSPRARWLTPRSSCGGWLRRVRRAERERGRRASGSSPRGELGTAPVADSPLSSMAPTPHRRAAPSPQCSCGRPGPGRVVACRRPQVSTRPAASRHRSKDGRMQLYAQHPVVRVAAAGRRRRLARLDPCSGC